MGHFNMATIMSYTSCLQGFEIYKYRFDKSYVMKLSLTYIVVITFNI